jgi:hypothetical protein
MEDKYYRDFDDLKDQIEIDERSAPRTRKRDIPFYGAGSVYKTQSENRELGTKSETSQQGFWSPIGLRGKQVTVSDYHPNWRRHLNARQDVGGAFHTSKQWAEMPYGNPTTTIAGSKKLSPVSDWAYQYVGPVLAHSGVGMTFPPSAESTDSVLNAWGADVIASLKPTNDVANLSTTLIELYREGLPKLAGASLWRKRLKDIDEKVAAGELLNYEFALKPLVSEITNVMTFMSGAGKLIDQFNRDSGRVVRRRAEFAPETSTEEIVWRSNLAGPHILSSNSEMYIPIGERVPGKVVRRRVTSRRRWFSGAFTYHSPMMGLEGYGEQGENVLSVLGGRANQLLGLEIDPSTLYNLTPWSWAVDWVSSLGSVIDNLTDYQKYGLVMPYGYVMEHSYVQDTYFWIGQTNLYSAASPSPIRMTTQVKKRVRANPFGFGLTWDALDATQRAILVALGITRHR